MWQALTIGLIFLTVTVVLQLKLQKHRRRRLQNLDLRPNCLLTRHPILFVSSRRSLFRLFEPWNEIPSFLREHGYEVFVLEPVFSRISRQARSFTDQINQALTELTKSSGIASSKLHLIAESSLESEWLKLTAAHDPRIASLTLAVREKMRSTTSQATHDRALALKPHAFRMEELSLDDLTPLAERTSGWNRVAVILLQAHNLFSSLRNRSIQKIDPIAVGQILTANWLIEAKFLNRAVELAERDARFVD